MLQNIIGRKREIELIENCIHSNKPEFIAIYGRRRIGKTYLVKQLLGEKFSFYMTGVYQCSKNEMIAYFSEQLALYSGKKQTRPKNLVRGFLATACLSLLYWKKESKSSSSLTNCHD